jgi:hypothetical protein
MIVLFLSGLALWVGASICAGLVFGRAASIGEEPEPWLVEGAAEIRVRRMVALDRGRAA